MAKRGANLLIFNWTMIFFTFILVCIRLYTRISRSASWLPSISDIMVILAWASFTLQCACDSVLFAEGFFNEGISASNPSLSPLIRVLALKIYYVESVMYLNCVYAVKGAMLCLFHEFFPRYMIKTRRCLIFTSWFVFLGWSSQILMTILWCLPVDRNWSLDEGYYCSAMHSDLAVILNLVPHFASDLMIYVLPIPVVVRLSLPKRQKIGLGVTFSMGFLCIFFASAFLAASYMSEDLSIIWPFATLEQTWAIVVACCPALRAWCGDRDSSRAGSGHRRAKSSLASGSRFRSKGNLQAELARKNDVEVGVLVVEMRDNTQRHESTSAWEKARALDDKISISS